MSLNCYLKSDVFQQEVPTEDALKGPDKMTTSHTGFGVRDLFFDSPIVHPNYWKEKPNKKLFTTVDDRQDTLPRLGYHGKNKYKYAFHEPWKPLDRLSLLAQAEKDEIAQTEEQAAELPKKELTPQ
ncbi:unnamed protein product [Colias eurytheme]|nr:unnamed protein product [Colias eurytheme]